MFIKEIKSSFDYIYKGAFIKQGERRLTYGQYKDKHIAIDNYIKDGQVDEKRFVIWDNFMQKIINKKRKPDGKGFDRIG